MKALWLLIALCLSGVAALKMVEAQQCRGPLTLAQIEALLDIPAPDRTIAREVSKCGLDFTPDAALVEKLRRRGAGAQTIQAISALLPKPRPTPRPTPTPMFPPMAPAFSSFVEKLGAGVSLEMIHLTGGQFLMGSPDSEKDRDSDEGPQHRVTVPSFFIGKHEVTQAQWQAVMNNNPAHFKGDNNRPVEMVSWNDAKAFCDKLSQMTGKAYRLPSEAEWEYACRARTTGSYAGNLEAMAWYGDNSGLTRIDSLALWNQLNKDVDKYYDQLIKNGNKTHPVGQKQANAFGLFDMHGNVWEWCEDVWHDSYGGQNGNPPTDGSAWLSGGDSSFRVLRGGSWNYIDWGCRSAYRIRNAPGVRNVNFGFRVAVSARTL